MIQCQVQACGEICQSTLEKTSKEGKKYLVVTVKVPLVGRDNSVADLFLSVSIDGDYSQIGNYPLGKKVCFKGKMIPRKYKGLVYYNVKCDDSMVTAAPGDAPFISGSMDFKGKTSKQIKEFSDKKNRSYQSFSAFSSNKVGETTEFIWVHFMNFKLNEGKKVEPEQAVSINGEFHFSVYKNALGLECMVKNIEPWEWNKSKDANGE